jgi:hypothetical protein
MTAHATFSRKALLIDITSEYTGLRMTVVKVHTGGWVFLSFQMVVKGF